MITVKMLTSTRSFMKEKGRKTLGHKKRKDDNRMENFYDLTLKTNIAMLGFSGKTVLRERNMPISQIQTFYCSK